MLLGSQSPHLGGPGTSFLEEVRCSRERIRRFDRLGHPITGATWFMSLRGVLRFHIVLAAAFLWPMSAQIVDVPTPGQDIYLEPKISGFHATVTAYSSSPDETWGDPFVTASGRRVFDGLVACPRTLAFGTKVRIGERTYHCYDRLHRKYDDRFDIWMSSKNAALAFGKRILLVEVVES